jgi:hypothetical protein
MNADKFRLSYQHLKVMRALREHTDRELAGMHVAQTRHWRLLERYFAFWLSHANEVIKNRHDLSTLDSKEMKELK